MTRGQLPERRRADGKRVLVTGAHGFLGKAVVDAFVATGARVTGVDVRGGAEATRIDITDPHDLDRLMRAGRFNVVVHLAAFGAGDAGLKASADVDPRRAVEVNVVGAADLYRRARDSGVDRILFASSTTVYGPAREYDGAPIAEDVVFKPMNIYGATKVASELLGRTIVASSRTDFTAVRLPLVYGSDRWYGGALSVLTTAVATLQDGELPKAAFSDSATDWIHVTDAARVFVALAASERVREAYHVVGHTGSMLGLVRAIASQSGCDAEEIGNAGPEDAPLPLIDDAVAREELAFRARVDTEVLAARSLIDPLGRA